MGDRGRPHQKLVEVANKVRKLDVLACERQLQASRVVNLTQITAQYGRSRGSTFPVCRENEHAEIKTSGMGPKLLQKRLVGQNIGSPNRHHPQHDHQHHHHHQHHSSVRVQTCTPRSVSCVCYPSVCKNASGLFGAIPHPRIA